MSEIATLFAALADPTRLRLLYLVKDGEICVCFLQGVLQTNQPKISRHLAYLKRAGLVAARKEGKWMHYCLKRQPADSQKLLQQAFDSLARAPQIRSDVQRLKNIRCCPSRYGISDPLRPGTGKCKAA
ncbi:MAG: Arsenical resistance operon repressor [Pedosphaera sp.]|jgi:ArsR family transcriptional regulator|nr:Arsenical resistance operon repressor [Pedosphaera sp.]